MVFTIAELQAIIAELKAALVRAAANGGVTSYTINSGQGTTTVQQASITTITEAIKSFGALLNEQIAIESGANFTYVRDWGI